MFYISYFFRDISIWEFIFVCIFILFMIVIIFLLFIKVFYKYENWKIVKISYRKPMDESYLQIKFPVILFVSENDDYIVAEEIDTLITAWSDFDLRYLIDSNLKKFYLEKNTKLYWYIFKKSDDKIVFENVIDLITQIEWKYDYLANNINSLILEMNERYWFY